MNVGSKGVWLAAGPVLMVVGLAVVLYPDWLVIGPLDRAKVTFAIGFPLLVLAPGLAGIAERRTQLARWSQFLAAATSIAFGTLVLAAVAVDTKFVGCQPVTSPIEVLPQALVPGAFAAAAYAFAYRGAAGRASRPTVALVLGALRWLAVAAVGYLIIAFVLNPVVPHCLPR